MIITFTAAQVAQITDLFWTFDLGPVTLDDGTTVQMGPYNEWVSIREIPLFADLVEPALQEDGTWAAAHPTATEEDAILIRMELDWRAAQLAAIAALPSAERPTARANIRAALRTRCRVEARRSARVARRRSERIEDRIEARRQMRADARARAVEAGLIVDPDPEP